jgi:hypothetical protein
MAVNFSSDPTAVGFDCEVHGQIPKELDGADQLPLRPTPISS